MDGSHRSPRQSQRECVGTDEQVEQVCLIYRNLTRCWDSGIYRVPYITSEHREHKANLIIYSMLLKYIKVTVHYKYLCCVSKICIYINIIKSKNVYMYYMLDSRRVQLLFLPPYQEEKSNLVFSHVINNRITCDKHVKVHFNILCPENVKNVPYDLVKRMNVNIKPHAT